MPATPRSPARRSARERGLPVATYRLQLNARQDFRAAARLSDYLAALGISHCYASPILQARRESLHGYDGVDPTRLSETLGGEAGFATWQDSLRRAGLNLLVDIVPNHLCVVGSQNPWWEAVLTFGRGAPSAATFDIDWDPPEESLRGHVLLPQLGRPLAETLAAGELRVVWEHDALRLAYYEHRWPLAPHSWLPLLTPLAAAPDVPARARVALRSVLRVLRSFRPPAQVLRPLSARHRNAFDAARRSLGRLLRSHPALRAALNAQLEALHAERPAQAASTGQDVPKGGPWGSLLAGQAWQLEHWREAGRRLNVRRFFDVNELAGLRQEVPGVFRATHARVLALAAEGAVAGLRVDHPDGLADPTGYLRRLRRALGSALRRAGHATESEPGAGAPAGGYVVVEKILDPGERRRGDWPVEGGTGYDMLYRLNAVQVDVERAAEFRAAYVRLTGDALAFADHVREGKRLVLHTAFVGELERLARLLAHLARGSGVPAARRAEQEPATWRRALEALIVGLPVYRTYVAGGRPAAAEDAHWITVAVSEARKHHGELEPALLHWVERVLTDPAGALPRAGRNLRVAAQDFVTRFQQLSSAVMAKGVEDTAFYRYVPLVSLNEVGGDPGNFGIRRGAFHTWNGQRARRWPHALSATSTHDTKRGEGVRARLNALSEIPAEWEAAVHGWRTHHARYRTELATGPAPSPIAEYLVYQTLVGAWPLRGRRDRDWAGFPDRIGAYLIKALREAKQETSWVDPNSDYEAAVLRFVHALLAERPGNRFPAELEAFLQPVLRAGLHNALGQTLLKIALPGVPDFYQGTELWDFSLVDPDNRRPVDFALRRRVLAGLPDPPTPQAARKLLAVPLDGRIKLHVIRQGLALRHRRRLLFAGSDYRPLESAGRCERHALAFARTRGRNAVVAAVGRLYLGLPGARAARPRLPIGRAVWGNTVLRAGRGVPGGLYRDALTGAELRPHREQGALVFPLQDVFAHLPLALLERIA